MEESPRYEYLHDLIIKGIARSVPLAFSLPILRDGEWPKDADPMTRVPPEVLYESYAYGFLAGMDLEKQDGDRELVVRISKLISDLATVKYMVEAKANPLDPPCHNGFLCRGLDSGETVQVYWNGRAEMGPRVVARKVE